MAAGAKDAPAIARAISFLFIRISFVEVRPCLLLANSWEPRGDFVAPFFRNFLEFFLRTTRIMPKQPRSLKRFFAGFATNDAPCCYHATPSGPLKK
jgi:hypothetical protein